MAQKRMFDRSIIETDSFLNVSLSAKALYFLLGMEADDEGFVSPARVIRLYGGESGDIKNLVDTGLVIPLKSGVVVITDWNENNWLDSRRIKPTRYQEDKKTLILTGKRYMLSNGLATAKTEESSIEENRGEQNRIEERKLTPSEEAKSFFSKGLEYENLKEIFSKDKEISLIIREFDKFILYWTEKNKSGTKQRWEQEPTFEVRRRIFTWLSKVDNFSSNKRITNII